MNKRSLRILGLIIMICVTVLPLVVVIALNNIFLLQGQPQQQLIIAKRSIMDKKIPNINNQKLEEYNQVGCGQPQFPAGKTRFYIEEKVIPNQDPVLDFFEDALQSKSCYFTSTPTYYILNQQSKDLKQITLEQAQQLTIDSTIVDYIRGKPSLNKQNYQFKTKNSIYSIFSNKIEITNTNLGIEKSNTYSLQSDTDNATPIFNFNLTNLEVLGQLK
jgi:hypothetical protein